MEQVILKEKSEHFLKKNIYTGDIESYLDDNNEWVFKIGNVYNGYTHTTFNNVLDFFEYVSSRNQIKFVYFHNLDFDLLFFLKFLDNSYIDNVEILRSGNTIISAKFKDITFINSFMLFPMSLKSIVKDFLVVEDKDWLNDKSNVLSLKYDVLIKYCRKDCYYLYNALAKFFNEVSQYYDKKFLTISSLTLNIFTRNFLNNENIFLDENRNILSEKEYYYGGHTEKFINEVYRFKGLKYYDVNSLYPDCMRFCKVGVGKSKFIKNSLKSLKWLKQNDKVFLASVRLNIINEDDRIFFSRIDGENRNKLLFGEHDYIISEVSFDYIIKYEIEILKVYRVNYYEGYEYIFKEFIEKFYAYRDISKFHKSVYKMLLNYLYGKFGQREETKKVFINPNNFLEFDYIVDNGSHILCEKDDTLHFSKIKYLRKDIAGKITELARIKMSEYRKEIKKNGGEVFYQDTDSIITNIELDEKFVDSKKLGYMKLENKQGDLNGYIIGAKLYYLTNGKETFKAHKGVKNMTQFNFINLVLNCELKNIKWSDDRSSFTFNYCGNFPNRGFYLERFSKPKMYFNKNFFGIYKIPFNYFNITQRLD